MTDQKKTQCPSCKKEFKNLKRHKCKIITDDNRGAFVKAAKKLMEKEEHVYKFIEDLKTGEEKLDLDDDVIKEMLKEYDDIYNKYKDRLNYSRAKYALERTKLHKYVQDHLYPKLEEEWNNSKAVEDFREIRELVFKEGERRDQINKIYNALELLEGAVKKAVDKMTPEDKERLEKTFEGLECKKVEVDIEKLFEAVEKQKAEQKKNDSRQKKHNLVSPAREIQKPVKEGPLKKIPAPRRIKK